MKLSCTKENLHQGLAITSHVSSKNVNLPILNNVLLRADSSGLRLISTNLEIAITCHIRGKVEQPGEYTVPSKLFFDYVNLLPNDRVDIDLLDDALKVQSQASTTKIKGIPATEFPLVPPVSGGVIFNLPVSQFKDALSQVLFAAATNESRPELAGVYLAFSKTDGPPQLIMAATDSYRLAEGRVFLPDVSEERSFIVPQRTLSELSRIITVFKDDVEAADHVQVEVTDNQVVFRFGGVELTSRLIEGNYPDYTQIIPQSFKTDITVNRSEFIQAIKTASLFSKNGLYDVRLALDANSQTVQLSANDSTRGENTVTINGMMNGGDNQVTLNFRYLLDGVNAMNSENVVFKLIDGGNPCLLKPDDEKVGYHYIVMPIRQ